MKARVIRPGPSWWAHRRTRPPWVTVPFSASGVQPSVRERRTGGRSIRAVFGLRRGRGVLRRLRVGAGAVRSVCGGAAACAAPGGQPGVRAFAAGASVGEGASGAISCPPEGPRNGCDLDADERLVDVLVAVDLRGGGVGHRGDSVPCPRFFIIAFPDVRARGGRALRALPSRTLRPSATERARSRASSPLSAAARFRARPMR